MNPRIAIVLAVLGVSAEANPGSAETSEPFVFDTARPALIAAAPEVPGATLAAYPSGGTTLAVRRYYKTPPPPPPATAGPQPVQLVPREPRSWFVMRGGFMDTEGSNFEDWMAGVKTVGHVSPMFRLGGSFDYHRKTNSQRTVEQTFFDVNGQPVTTSHVVSEYESDLWPLMGVAEITLPLPVFRPYAGVGGGWEWLSADIYDPAAQAAYPADYNGWGWQYYAGVDLTIAPKLRLNGEVFRNESRVSRDVYDPYANVRFEETVDVGGTGARFGLSLGF